MKKFTAALLTVAMVMAANMSAMADPFDGFSVLEREDGTYACAFPRATVFMDEMWHTNTVVALGRDGRTVSFYHKGSYDAYADEGLTGGLLFTLGASVNTDFEDLPQFIYIDFDDEEAMNYYAELPTDYQAYVGDEAIRAEYDELWNGVDDVILNIQIMGGAAQYAEAPETISSEGFDYHIQDGKAAITRYTGSEKAVAIPSEIDGCPVTGIGSNAFSYQTLKSVSIPDSVRTIGENAFDHCMISDSLEFPKDVHVAQKAFRYVTLPPTLVIPTGVTLEEEAFSYCHGSEIICIEPGVTLKSYAFSYCSDMGQVVCAQGSRLGVKPFSYCSGIEKVTLCGDAQAEENLFDHCGYVLVTTEQEYETLKQAELDNVLNKAEGDAAQEITLDILNSPCTLDGVTATLAKATAKKDPKTRTFSYSFSGTLENISDKEIERVIFKLTALGENGEKLWDIAEIYEEGETTLAPQETIAFDYDAVKSGKKSVPKAAKVEIQSVKTAFEPSSPPPLQTGEYLYLALGDERLANMLSEPPVQLSLYVDEGGYGRCATFTQGETLDRALELFCAIQIGKETDEWVTDNYNSISLTWADGTQTSISLNLYNLEYRADSKLHMFKLTNLGEFWTYCKEYLEEA